MKFRLPKKVADFASKSIIKMRKASPAILVVAGVGAMIGSTVLACKAARKMDDPIEDAKKEIEDIHEREDTDKSFAQSQEAARSKLKVWAKLLKRLTILFGPALLVGGLGVIGIFGGFNMLNRRYLGLAAAYSALGQELVISDTKQNPGCASNVDSETGEVKTFSPKVEYYYAEPDENSLTPMGSYAFKFTKDCCYGAHDAYDMDKLTVIANIKYMREKLNEKLKGYLSYSDCLAYFGYRYPDTKEGRNFYAMAKTMGWLREDGKTIMMKGESPEYSNDPAFITAYDLMTTPSGEKWWKKYIIIDPMCRKQGATYFGPILEKLEV